VYPTGIMLIMLTKAEIEYLLIVRYARTIFVGLAGRSAGRARGGTLGWNCPINGLTSCETTRRVSQFGSLCWGPRPRQFSGVVAVLTVPGFPQSDSPYGDEVPGWPGQGVLSAR
jgi:hypothetical protein